MQALSPEPTTPEDHQEQLAGLSTIGAIKQTWGRRSIWFIWIGAVLVSSTIAYDQQTYATFQPYATSEFRAVALLSTISVVQNVVSSGVGHYSIKGCAVR